ncbi:hypothetical protein CEXT_753511 [Caerostris extrusa]|uniref:Uncharacterized protein n=1 Tax=Caerostris extrusa TaxID=172846 RepID=A0AAV4RJT4_CAEEX|nr:hypothetical protein CEXT_753511 [Caerostris extrusa]
MTRQDFLAMLKKESTSRLDSKCSLCSVKMIRQDKKFSCHVDKMNLHQGSIQNANLLCSVEMAKHDFLAMLIK